MARLTAAVVLGAMGIGAQACSIVTNVRTTFYGAPDNDPPGPATAYNCGGRNYIAGGTGTYADPLSFATAPGEYNQCEIVYFPYLRKYLRMEDYCAQCTDDYGGGVKHIDIWTGSATGGGDAQIACENALTPDAAQVVVRDPPATGLVVDAGALWDGACHTRRVHAGAAGSCLGTGGTAPACATGCSWAGHCIGCPCVTFDDCSDDYVCTNSYCAAL